MKLHGSRLDLFGASGQELKGIWLEDSANSNTSAESKRFLRTLGGDDATGVLGLGHSPQRKASARNFARVGNALQSRGGLTQASVQGYLSPRRIHRCAQSAGGTNCPRPSKSGQKTSLADSITNIGWRKWQPRIQTEFLRTTVLPVGFLTFEINFQYQRNPAR